MPPIPIRVILYQSTAGDEIVLEGTRTGDDFELGTLSLSAGQSLALSSPLEGDRSVLLAQGGAAETYFFHGTLPASVTLRSALVIGAAREFLNWKFSAAATLTAEIVIYIPTTLITVQPRLTLRVCGRIEITSADTAIDVCCARIVLDKLFGDQTGQGDWGLLWSPPEFGVHIPAVALAWTFPQLPEPPFNLPARSFSLAPLPGRIRYRSLLVSLEPDATTFEIRGLELEGAQQSIECDAKLVWSNGTLDPSGSWIRFIRPALSFAVPEWYFDDDCLILAGTGTELRDLLRWVLPEFDEVAVEGEIEWTLRLHWDGGELREIRLDLVPSENPAIALPGFTLTPPQHSTLHLVFQRTDADGDRFWFGVGAATDSVARLSLPFTLLRDEARELHRPDEASDKSLVLVCTAKVDVTLLVLEIEDVSGRHHLHWLQRVDPPLTLLDIHDPATACPLTSGSRVPLDPTSFALTLEGLAGFTLPFLKGETGGVGQFITVTKRPYADGDVDFASQAIRVVLDIVIRVGTLELAGEFTVRFNWAKLGFEVDHERGIEITIPHDFRGGSLFGLDWELTPRRGPSFLLLTKNSDFRIKQLPESRFTLHLRKATTDQTSIVFSVSNFCLSPEGIDLDAVVTSSPAKLNALNTTFTFSEGAFQVRANSITSFTLIGGGPLPPDLVGPSHATISLQFAQRGDTREIALVACTAHLECTNLKCTLTRFEFSISALGLDFVEDGGRYHLYFTVWGKARFVLEDTDDPQGPLAWLPTIELDLVGCPLTTDVSVLQDHIEFLIKLPEPKTFSFLGCFEFELRGIGFAPLDTAFREPTPAMRLSGQISFADVGDEISSEIEFHDMHIGLPAKGKLFPQIHLQGLTVRISQGAGLSITGTVNFYDEGTKFGGGVVGEGFAGGGDLSLNDMKFDAGFAFLRMRHEYDRSSVRAWFIYVEGRRFSIPIPIPVMQVYLREAGLGFGYRYTLAMIKSADEQNDPKKLLKTLKEQAKSQGELSRFEQWREDIEEPGENPRWTIALRALISQTSVAGSKPVWSITDEQFEKEAALPCLFAIDAVAAVRSDLTFLMVGRAWLWTNYYDLFHDLPKGLRESPSFTGFLLFSPRQHRLLVNLASNPDGKFGEHSVAFPLVRTALKNSRFSATLLVEPGLVHYELGWPNQLQWKGDFGPLKLDFRGGMIVRAAREEFVMGQSFLARGTLQFSAGVDLGCVGARLSATADVAFGARYIGLVSFKKPFGGSALYGGAGIEINVTVAVAFWIEIDALIGSITINFDFDFAVNFTASVEVGYLPKSPADAIPGVALMNLGVRGSATLALGIMGHSIHFSIKVGWEEGRVETAYNITRHVLNMGLEAEEVEAIPGTDRPAKAIQNRSRVFQGDGNRRASLPVGAAGDASKAPGAQLRERPLGAAGAARGHRRSGRNPTQAINERSFAAPSYNVLSSECPDGYTYFVLVPSAIQSPAEGGQPERGFIPVPPKEPLTADDRDFELVDWEDDERLERLLPDGNWDRLSEASWKVEWQDEFENGFRGFERNKAVAGQPPEDGTPYTLSMADLFRMAFVCEAPATTPEDRNPLEGMEPLGDPELLPEAVDVLVDERVRNAGLDAYESAVRGAVDQFASAPYFKRSPCEYDLTLMRAFSDKTSIYDPEGHAPGPQDENLTPEATRQQQAIQMRGTILQRLLREFREIVRSARGGLAPRPSDLAHSLLPRLGLMFRFQGGATAFTEFIQGLKIKQRVTPFDRNPVDPERDVWPFMEPEWSFGEAPPLFKDVVYYTHEGTTAIDWTLDWHDRESLEAREGQRALCDRQKDIEQHLAFYHVRRRWLDGNARDEVFQVKASSVLHRERKTSLSSSDDTVDTVMRQIRPRFQFVDHFEGESSEEIANLPPEGKRYMYTITPVDQTGVPSSRPLMIAVRRMPATPPPPVTRSELVVDYRFGDQPVPQPTPRVEVIRPATLRFLWSSPVDPAEGTRVPVAGYRIVFRAEESLPQGQYAQDAEAGGPRSRGLATSNARPMRSDRFLEFAASYPRIHEAFDESNRERRYYVDLFDLQADDGRFGVRIDEGILPQHGTTEWNPRSWRVYVQTQSTSGVYSALVPISIRIRFLGVDEDDDVIAAAQEERRPLALEWLPNPVTANLLPADDLAGEVGFALVPMPPDDPQGDTGLSEEQTTAGFWPHPGRRRVLKFRWNQAPSTSGDHPPLAINAGFELYEFDADANVAEVLNHEPLSTCDFRAWAREARLRKIQEFELMMPEGLLVTPANTLNPKRWEAWYPSTVARRKLISEGPRDAGGPTLHNSEALYSAWFSWRESYLEWPEFPVDDSSTHSTETSAEPKLGPGVMHPELQAILDAFIDKLPEALQDSIVIDLAPICTTPATTVEAFVQETSPKADPYGWAMLQRMGLSIAFVLHDRKTGEPVSMTSRLAADRDDTFLTTLRDVLSSREPKFARHLHLEQLVQPAKATRLRAEEQGDKVSTERPESLVGDEDWLATVQLSLRPAWSPHSRYYRHLLRPSDDLEGREKASDTGKIKIRLTPTGTPTPAADSVLILKSDTDVDEFRLPVNVDTEIPFRVRNTGQSWLLLRVPVELTPELKIEWNVESEPPLLDSIDIDTQGFSVTDHDSGYFSFAPKAAPAMSPHAKAWDVLRSYVHAMNPQWPQEPADKQFPAWPTSDENPALPPLLQWLQRFFDHGGNRETRPGIETTGKGWWLATAYVRSATPMPVAPDVQTGILTYLHNLEDQYAHAYRFYMKPLTRYHRLWMSIAQSRALFPPLLGQSVACRIAINLENLWQFLPPEPGGLDLVLPRIRPIAAPALLFSGRLDGPEPDGAIEIVFTPASGDVLPEVPVFLQDRVEIVVLEQGRRILAWTGGLAISEDQRARLEQWSQEATWGEAFRLAALALLNRLRQALGMRPPGKTWQVIIAKHAEQTLSERNRTLMRRLAYRQVAVSLLRRFQFDVEARWFHSYNTRRYRYVSSDDNEEVLGPGRIAVLAIDDQEHEIAPEADDIVSLAEVLEQTIGPKGKVACEVFGSDRVIRIESDFVLTLVATGGGAPDANLLVNTPAVTEWRSPHPGEAPELPGQIVPPVPLSVDKVSNDVLRQLDLPARLGHFGQGALVYQWQTLPYYYEHLLMCVAQSSDTISRITWVTQRNFEYQSPAPRALIDAQSGQPGRYRRIRLRAEYHWKCLTSSGQAAWPMEAPDSSSADSRPFSEMPDAAVVYQFVLTRPANVVQVLSEIFFAPGGVGNFGVRNFNTKIGPTTWKTEIVGLNPWGTDAASPRDMYLETKLLSEPNAPLLVRRPVTSRHGVLPSSTLDPARFVIPDSAALCCVRRLEQPSELDDLRTLLLQTPRDLSLVAQARVFLERVREFHAPWSHFTYSGTLPGPAQIPAGFDLQKVEPDGVFGVSDSDWSYTLDDLRVLHDWLVAQQFDANFLGAVRVVLERLLSSEGWQALTNPSVTALEPQHLRAPDIVEVVSLGLEQLKELVDDGNRVVLDAVQRELVWTGAMSDEQRTILEGDNDTTEFPGWVNMTPFSATIRALLEAVRNDQFEQALPVEEPIPLEVPEILAERVAFETTADPWKFIWTGIHINADERDKLQSWHTNPSYGAAFRDAITALLNHLSTVELRVPIAEADWQPRPEATDFYDIVSDKAFLGNSIVEVDDLILPDELRAMQHVWQAEHAASAIALRLLYNDALSSGCEGASLEARAFRGGAAAKSELMTPIA